MSKTLLGLYERMKKALENAGGYEGLSDEQRELFNNAVDLLMAAKFDQAESEPVLDAVMTFLDAMSPESEPLPEPEPEGETDIHDELQGRYTTSLRNASVLIRAADALDRAGQRELVNELDVVLRKLAEEKK
jgi:hypothetical protein